LKSHTAAMKYIPEIATTLKYEIADTSHPGTAPRTAPACTILRMKSGVSPGLALCFGFLLGEL